MLYVGAAEKLSANYVLVSVHEDTVSLTPLAVAARGARVDSASDYHTARSIPRSEESVLQPCKLLASVAECVEKCIVVHGASERVQPDEVCLGQHVRVLDCVL